MKAWMVIFLMISATSLEIIRIYLGLPEFHVLAENTYKIAVSAIILNYIVVFTGALVEIRSNKMIRPPDEEDPEDDYELPADIQETMEELAEDQDWLDEIRSDLFD